jgi:hypothetical protein
MLSFMNRKRCQFKNIGISRALTSFFPRKHPKMAKIINSSGQFLCTSANEPLDTAIGIGCVGIWLLLLKAEIP